MDFKTRVEELIQAFLEERKDIYLVDLKISAGNDVVVILDGDESLSIQDCLDASRAIEFNLDREEADFSLQVMSAGLSEPLKLPRQYKKNVGRELEVTTEDGEVIKGELLEADEEKIQRKEQEEDLHRHHNDVKDVCRQIGRECMKDLCHISCPSSVPSAQSRG